MPDIKDKKPNGDSDVQSVLFNIKKWTISDAKKWLKENNFTGLIAEETDEYYRFRQINPDKFKRFATIDAGKGIKLIVGFVKEAKLVKEFIDIDYDALIEFMNLKGYDNLVQNTIIELLQNFAINDLMSVASIIYDIDGQINSKLWEKTNNIKLIKQESDKEKAKKIQETRSKKYGIRIKEDTNITIPGKWKEKNLTDKDFADPVNYKLPIHDVEHTRNAQARFNQKATKEQYNNEEIKIIQDRIDESKKKFKIGEFKKNVKFVKETANTEKRLIYGVVVEPENIDTDNQWTDETNIEFACHAFMKYFGEYGYGVEHIFMNIDGIKLVENYIAPINFVQNKTMIKKGSWIMVHHIENDDVWEKIKNGELTGYSFEGTGFLLQQTP